MITTEQREKIDAAEKRLSKINEACEGNLCRNYCCSWPGRCSEDTATLFDASRELLRLIPADDGDALDDEYLDGLYPGREVGEETSWWINLEVWISFGNYGYSVMHGSMIIVLTIETRGDLRRLLAGLKIPVPS